jgi:hypothetical protein
VLLSLFLAPTTTRKGKQSNQPKLTTHPVQSHPSIPRKRCGKKFPSQERKLLFACFVAVLVTRMSFASVARELTRGDLIMLETHHDEFIDFLPYSYSHASSRFSHGPNHRSYDFRSRENNFVPRRLGYDPRPYRGDHFPRRPHFSIGGSYTHFEPIHLDGTRFPRRDSHPTRSNGEVLNTVKSSSDRMVKCWIPKIYLTNPSTEPSTCSSPI